MDVGVKYGRRSEVFLVNRMEAENLPFQRAFPRLGVFSSFLFAGGRLKLRRFLRFPNRFLLFRAQGSEPF